MVAGSLAQPPCRAACGLSRLRRALPRRAAARRLGVAGRISPRSSICAQPSRAWRAATASSSRAAIAPRASPSSTPTRCGVTYNLLLRMGAMLRAASGSDVVHLARIAGQFAKPRSSRRRRRSTESRCRAIAATRSTVPRSLRPHARRIRSGCSRRIRQAQVTIELLQAYASASYADLAEGPPRGGRSKQSPSAGRDVHQPRGVAAQLRAGADALRRAERAVVGDVRAHAVDRRPHPSARRRACRVRARHRQSGRPEMRAEPSPWTTSCG